MFQFLTKLLGAPASPSGHPSETEPCFTVSAQSVGVPSADFTVADVLAWARTKPALEEYDYVSNEDCAICQFLRETGRAANPSAGKDCWNEWSGPAAYEGRASKDCPIPIEVVVSLPAAKTFGELVKRLEKLLPAKPISDTWTRAATYLADLDQLAEANNG